MGDTSAVRRDGRTLPPFVGTFCHFLWHGLSTILTTYKGGLKIIMTIETMVGRIPLRRDPATRSCT